jgi:hypothetical protein
MNKQKMRVAGYRSWIRNFCDLPVGMMQASVTQGMWDYTSPWPRHNEPNDTFYPDIRHPVAIALDHDNTGVLLHLVNDVGFSPFDAGDMFKFDHAKLTCIQALAETEVQAAAPTEETLENCVSSDLPALVTQYLSGAPSFLVALTRRSLWGINVDLAENVMPRLENTQG